MISKPGTASGGTAPGGSAGRAGSSQGKSSQAKLASEKSMAAAALEQPEEGLAEMLAFKDHGEFYEHATSGREE